MAERPIGVLFVCLGNICRSPLAEGLFIHLARQRGVEGRFHVDSAGTGAWHVGKRADPRSIAVARAHGVTLPSIARQIDPERDFLEPGTIALDPADEGALGFDWLIAMDQSNAADMLERGAPRQRVRLLRSFDPLCAHLPDHQREVPDPYYGGPEGFERMYEMIDRACRGMLDELLEPGPR